MNDRSSSKPWTADVVVIGGGGSGLAAAIEAATLGRSVVLVEKAPELGGSTAWSVGSITANNTPHQVRRGILDSPQEHFEDLQKFNAVCGVPDNPGLSRLLVENVHETVRWLMSMGVEFFGPLNELPHRKPRMHVVLPNSRAYIYHLSRRARALGVDIRTSVRASQFLVLGAKAHAASRGSALPTYDDVRAVAPAVLAHRLVLGFEAEADGRTTRDVIAELLDESRRWI